MEPQTLDLATDYDYKLPRERIAQHPLTTRSDARVMVVHRSSGQLEHYHVRDLPELDLFRAGDALVLNNSRVVPARLVGLRTATGGRWEGLFLRADSGSGVWEILSKTRGKLNASEFLTLQDRDGREGIQLEVIDRSQGGAILVKPTEPGEPSKLLDRYGRVPLPPYIRDGNMVDADVQTYQTVFAKQDGSVAAPTAGLHFTKPLLEQLATQNVSIHEATLHIGIGTFRPIGVDKLEDHQMHSEWGCLDATTAKSLQKIRDQEGRLFAVGTTAVRVLESASRSGKLEAWSGMTDLFIKPGYKFQAIDGLLTNFHLPKSSLLVLVCAFAGRDLALEAYHQAIENEYRFYSYGDAMLIL